jgi:hypothetical protein
MNLKTQQQQQEPSLTVDTRPLVSNPLSGDEGSLLSSPESLSPNAEFAAEGRGPALVGEELGWFFGAWTYGISSLKTSPL